jgi:hypothetical protein
MKQMYPKDLEELEFYSAVGGSWYFYWPEQPNRIISGDYSDFDAWRKAKLEKMIRDQENMPMVRQ